MSPSRLFISYSRKDLERVSPIVTRIREEYGFDVWIDLRGIESGKQFISVIISAIDDSSSVLFMLSSNSLRSSFCRNELTYAHQRGKRIFILSMDGTPLEGWVKDVCPEERFYDPSDIDICAEDIALQWAGEPTETEDVDGHEAVDLGLSVRWAPVDLDSDYPSKNGSGFRWGETSPGNYTEDWSEYVFSRGWEKVRHFERYSVEDGLTRLLPEDDAASVQWGKGWRIPRKEEWEELLENCVWTYQDRVLPDGTPMIGYLITSKRNRRSIFLPANASRGEETKPSIGLYWSADLAPIFVGYSRNDMYAYRLLFKKSRMEITDVPRIELAAIRAVAPKKKESGEKVKKWTLPEESAILPGDPPSIFVYSDHDSQGLAGFIGGTLKGETFLDISGYSEPSGMRESSLESLMDCLPDHDLFIVVFTDRTSSSRDMRKVVRYAISNGKPIIPVCLGSGSLSGWKLFEFAPIGVVDARSDEELTLLVESVRKLSGEKAELYQGCLRDFHEGLAAVRTGRWGYMDPSGRTAIALEYQEAGSFSEGLAPVRKNGLYGYIDKEGKVVIPFRFSHAESFSEGMAFVRTEDGSQGYIGHDGEMLFRTDGYSRCFSFKEGFARVEKDGRFGFIGPSGETVLGCVFDEAEDFSEGLACVGISGGGYSFVTPSGEFPLHSRFVKARSFSEGKAAVSDGSKWGYVDKDSSVVIPFGYDDAFPYSEGRACVCLRDRYGFSERYGFIDSDGELLFFGEHNGLMEMLDPGFGFIRRFPAVEPAKFHEGIVRISKGARSGYATSEGKWIIDPSVSPYYMAGDFHDRRAIVSRDGLYYVLTDSGEEIAFYGIGKLEYNR